jgi:starch-binding outer membrane protein SusE/F
MKNWLSTLSVITLASVLIVSCKKDETRAIVSAGPAGTLTATATTLNLDSSAANRNNTAVTFNWTPADFGYQAAVKYTLQIAKTGANFVNAREFTLNGGLSQAFTHAEFNQVALLAGLAPGTTGSLEARVRSTISAKVDTTYSNKITLQVKPYLVIINYPSLWVPGDYQGWSPATAPKISSQFSNGQYEGYVNIPSGGTYQFKFTSDPDWGHTNYGYATGTTSGNNASGTLSTSGSAGNLYVPVAGYFLMKANTTALTWSVTKTTWSMIGDFNGWGADAAMTYNPTTQVWTGTINAASAGGFKFRANADWGINLGDDGANGSLEYNGANIAITPGAHTITLDLHIPGNYTYTIQ